MLGNVCYVTWYIDIKGKRAIAKKKEAVFYCECQGARTLYTRISKFRVDLSNVSKRLIIIFIIFMSISGFIIIVRIYIYTYWKVPFDLSPADQKKSI